MIARRRKRPRVHSASFRTLWWLIRIEGGHAIETRYSSEEAPSWRRRWWLDLTTRARDGYVRRMLRYHPERRHSP